jgi:hypothetical protein
MSTSKPDEKEIAKVYAALQKYAQFKALTPQLQMLLAISLASRDLLTQIRGITSPDLVDLVFTGLMRDPNFVQAALCYAFGLPKHEPAPPADGRTPKKAPEAKADSIADAAIATIVDQMPAEEVPTSPVAVLAGLLDAAPKLVEMTAFVEGILHDARRNPPSIVMSREWAN